MNERDDRRNEKRREDDRQWIKDVNHQLLTVLTAAQVSAQRLKEITAELKAIDYVLRGNPEKDLDGLVYQIHQVQTGLSRLNAVIFMDSTGKKGALKNIEDLMSAEHRAEYRLKFWAPVVVAFLSLLGLLATNWDRITNYVRRPDPDPVAQEIENAKHPRPIYRHYTIHEGNE